MKKRESGHSPGGGGRGEGGEGGGGGTVNQNPETLNPDTEDRGP